MFKKIDSIIKRASADNDSDKLIATFINKPNNKTKHLRCWRGKTDEKSDRETCLYFV